MVQCGCQSDIITQMQRVAGNTHQIEDHQVDVDRLAQRRLGGADQPAEHAGNAIDFLVDHTETESCGVIGACLALQDSDVVADDAQRIVDLVHRTTQSAARESVAMAVTGECVNLPDQLAGAVRVAGKFHPQGAQAHTLRGFIHAASQHAHPGLTIAKRDEQAAWRAEKTHHLLVQHATRPVPWGVGGKDDIAGAETVRDKASTINQRDFDLPGKPRLAGIGKAP